MDRRPNSKTRIKRYMRNKLRDFLAEEPNQQNQQTPPPQTPDPNPSPPRPQTPTPPEPTQQLSQEPKTVQEPPYEPDPNRDPNQGVRRKDGTLPHELGPGEFACMVLGFGGESYTATGEPSPIDPDTGQQTSGSLRGESIQRKVWFFCTPNGLHGQLGDGYVVEEHDDGMITVAPTTVNGVTIQNRISELRDPNGPQGAAWQGYIRHGVWMEI